MDKTVLQEKLSLLYKEYTETFKPLLAEVEAIYECHPDTILNEIRAFTDHISRCYWEDITPDDIKQNISRARGHLKRAMFDCFKYINVYYHDICVNEFEERYKNVDLTIIDNGKFWVEYSEKKQAIIDIKTEAKKLETKKTKEAFDKFQDAHNLYINFQDFLNKNITKIEWARKKITRQKVIHKILQYGFPIVFGLIGIIATIYPEKAREFTDAVLKLGTALKTFIKQHLSSS